MYLYLTQFQIDAIKERARLKGKTLGPIVSEIVIEFGKQLEKHGWYYFYNTLYQRPNSSHQTVRTGSITLSWEAEKIARSLESKRIAGWDQVTEVAIAYCTYAETNPLRRSFYSQKKSDDVSNLRFTINILSKYPDLKSAAESASIFADNLESLSDEEYEEQYAPKMSD